MFTWNLPVGPPGNLIHPVLRLIDDKLSTILCTIGCCIGDGILLCLFFLSDGNFHIINSDLEFNYSTV